MPSWISLKFWSSSDSKHGEQEASAKLIEAHKRLIRVESDIHQAYARSLTDFVTNVEGLSRRVGAMLEGNIAKDEFYGQQLNFICEKADKLLRNISTLNAQHSGNIAARTQQIDEIVEALRSLERRKPVQATDLCVQERETERRVKENEAQLRRQEELSQKKKEMEKLMEAQKKMEEEAESRRRAFEEMKRNLENSRTERSLHQSEERRAFTASLLEKREHRETEELNLQKIRDEKEKHDDQLSKEKGRMVTEKKAQEQRERESLLIHTNELFSAQLSKEIDKIAAESKHDTQRALDYLYKETEGQRQFELRTNQLQDEIHAMDIESKKNEEEFLAKLSLETSERMQQAADRKQQVEDEEQRFREAREKAHKKYQEDWLARIQKDMDEDRERTRRHEEAREKMQKEMEEDRIRYENTSNRNREEYAARVDKILREEREFREEKESEMRAQEDEWRRKWRSMRDGFAEMMRNRMSNTISNEFEKKWDGRFTQLRTSFDPVRQAFSDLFDSSIDTVDPFKSLLQIKGRILTLRTALSNLNEIMLTENDQIAAWKEQQPNAYFLRDYGDAVVRITECIEDAKKECDRISSTSKNSLSTAQMEELFELREITERYDNLSRAIDTIPTVREMKRKYADA